MLIRLANARFPAAIPICGASRQWCPMGLVASYLRFFTMVDVRLNSIGTLLAYCFFPCEFQLRPDGSLLGEAIDAKFDGVASSSPSDATVDGLTLRPGRPNRQGCSTLSTESVLQHVLTN